MKLEDNFREMVLIDRGQDNGLFLGTQDLITPEDSLSMVDQEEMIIMIDPDQTREFHSLHRTSLGV